MNIGRASDGGDDSSINLTPLIDVVFQLLIFFMITMTFSSHNEYLLPVDLAEAAAGEPDDDNEFDGMTITVLADGQVVLDGEEPLADEVVRQRLLELYDHNAEASIVLRGDEAATHGRVLSLLDLVTQVGFSRVDMVVTQLE
ncbi:MAG: biopolymer transporter ExbD [Myxococcales bacterium]|nr:biopolymer transporter ExbD [Myxococcales bacterium]MCB9714700.1 biopolymer transporter ExbD [Myxococcales bacterium]